MAVASPSHLSRFCALDCSALVAGAIALGLLGACEGIVSGGADARDGAISADGSAGAGGAANGSTEANGTGTNGSTNNGGTTSGSSTGGVMAPGSSSDLVKRLGRDHFLIGLAGPDVTPTGKLDILYRYLVRTSDAGSAWPTWSSPKGAYATQQADNAKSHGAIPMFTTYEFIALGEGNLTGVADANYMPLFWDDMHLLAEKLKAFDGPAIVHIEPDFWGYAQQQGGKDPTKIKAFVPSTAPCSGLPQDLTGLGRCVVRIFHQESPKVVVGFQASVFGAFDAGGKPDGRAVGAFLKACSGGEADYVVVEALDRDAGCFEAKPAQYPCARGETTGWYWDETNKASPNFAEHFAWATTVHEGIEVPLLWWQVPMGVPNDKPGGSPNMYRDNRVRYFMSHLDELVKAGGIGVAFGAGAEGQTTQKTDGGQFEKALNAYNANPVVIK